MPTHKQIITAGVAFDLGGIAVMKCKRCGVVRELERFWRSGCVSQPAASRERVCTYCR